MTEISHEIHVLNGLIAHIIDSIDGYVAAAGDPKAGRLGEMFRARADERRIVVGNLQAQVARLGGEPEEYGTLLARAHRTFLKLKAAVAGNDPRAVINEVERGEDHIKARFETALADEELSFSVKSAIRAALASVREGYDQMSDLKRVPETQVRSMVGAL
jgi:uncharacterized protein (TIGR02284 family)